MTDKPSSSAAVQIKAKSDPEALLNDLSASLQSFQSTVRAWTAPGSNTLPLTASVSSSSGDTMKQSRLGLGAKAQRQVAAGDSVAGNIALKNQLTWQQKQNNGYSSSQSSHNNHKHGTHKGHQNNPHSKVKVSKPAIKKRDDSDDENIGRASLIKSKNKK